MLRFGERNTEIAMTRTLRLGIAICLAISIASCSPDAPTPTAVAAKPLPPSGERLVYLVGCVNCHHQTPKEILNAPPLLVVQGYSLQEFRTLLNTGVTRDGRDMYAQGSIMGIVAREQLSHFTEDEVAAVYEFLRKEWTAERAAREEAKIATFPPPTFMKK
jgi:mono/diheme cytochrome c family protein